MNKKEKSLSKQSYWYEFWEDFCPQCGRTDVTKERVYDRPKPAEWSERHHEKETWDYCD